MLTDGSFEGSFLHHIRFVHQCANARYWPGTGPVLAQYGVWCPGLLLNLGHWDAASNLSANQVPIDVLNVELGDWFKTPAPVMEGRVPLLGS